MKIFRTEAEQCAQFLFAFLAVHDCAYRIKAVGPLSNRAPLFWNTLDALENGRMGELGYSKITNILTALGMELNLRKASACRPTLEELMEEGRDDQSLDRRC
jgi:hypothetical protein